MNFLYQDKKNQTNKIKNNMSLNNKSINNISNTTYNRSNNTLNTASNLSNTVRNKSNTTSNISNTLSNRSNNININKQIEEETEQEKYPITRHVNENRDKNHYFIGNIFNNDDQIKILKGIQYTLRKKYQLKGAHWNYKFFTNLIYLGYFPPFVANLYMNDIVKNLLLALQGKIPILYCNYTGFKIFNDKTFYKVSLKFTDENNLLEKIIVPYLHQNAVLPIYESKKIIFKPAIDLIYFKRSYFLTDRKNEITLEIPKDSFKIDHLALIKGTPTRYRVGTPSTHDQMHLEEVNKYIFPFQG